MPKTVRGYTQDVPWAASKPLVLHLWASLALLLAAAPSLPAAETVSTVKTQQGSPVTALPTLGTDALNLNLAPLPLIPRPA